MTPAVPRVVVVGGGPAGCAAAIEAARAGAHVVMLEKGPPGRDKPCGDAYLPDAVAHLAGLGVDALSARGARVFDEVGLYAAGARLWRTRAGDGPGVVARRAVVDQGLRDVAARHCDVRHSTRVTAIHPPHASAAWVVATERGPVAADVVVVASGAGRRLAGQAGVASRAPLGRSLSVYVTGGSTQSADFHFGATPFPGYAWEFPLPDGLGNAGVCSVTDGPAPLAAALSAFLEARGLVAVGHARGGAGPFWTGVDTTWHDDRGALACGDAAGLVDELTGEGIGAALESGRLAGRAAAAWAAGRSSALVEYDDALSAGARARLADSPARRTWRQLSRLPA